MLLSANRFLFAVLMQAAVALTFGLCTPTTVRAQSSAALLIAVGAAGESEYEIEFKKWAQKWDELGAKAGWTVVRIADDEGSTPHARLQTIITEQAATATNDPLWLVLIGHGTYDGTTAKFNLEGPDVTAEDLKQWLAGAQRPLVIINCSSSSAPFVNVLAGPQRIVITATKSGLEVNFSRFGGYFVEALLDAKTDLDKDEQVSVLEAFISASGRVAEFYRAERRLATEHAILDDNGDGLGTPGDWFRGVRATRAARDGGTLDGLLARQTHLLETAQELQLSAEQRTARDALELQVEELRGRRTQMTEDKYYEQLEQLLVQLSRIYGETE